MRAFWPKPQRKVSRPPVAGEGEGLIHVRSASWGDLPIVMIMWWRHRMKSHQAPVVAPCSHGLSASGMRRSISAWIATASTRRCVPTSPRSRSASRGSASTALNSTLGSTTMSPATGVPHDRKEYGHGTQTSTRPHPARRGSGISTNASSGGEFAKALAQLGSKKQSGISHRVMEETRQAQIYGVRPARTFEQAAAKFVLENQHKRSIASDIVQLRLLMPWIGSVPIDRINGGVMRPWVDWRRKEGKSAGTVNHGLKIVRRILNLSASEWFDEHGLTWLMSAPRIKLLPDRDKRRPYPLSWAEQRALLCELPDYLAQMALFRRQHRLSRSRSLQLTLGVGG